METSASQDHPRPTGQYEFDEHQNTVIKELAAAMTWVAAPLFFLGILYSVAAVLCVIQAFRHPEILFSAAYVGMVAFLAWSLATWTKDAALSFQRIVGTKGNDVGYLMDALDNLRKKYSLMSLFIKIYAIVMVVALVVGAIVAIVGAFRN